VISICAGLVALLLVALAWPHRRRVFGARAYVLAALAACVWCWAIAGFEALEDPDHYPYPVVGVWLSAVSTCVAAVYVMARRAVSPRWSPPRAQVALFASEAIAIFLVEVTNPLHHLAGAKHDGETEPGIAFYLHAAYCLGLLLTSAAFLATRKVHAGPAQRRQIAVVQGLVLAVVLSEIGGLDVTQYIAVAGLAVLYRSMFREGLNELVPVARGAAVDQMSDYVFFFDTRGRLVDMNSSAVRAMEALEGRRPRAGASVEDVFGVDVPFEEAADTFLVLGEGPDAVETITRCTPLTDDSGAVAGWMVIARDLSTLPPRLGGQEGAEDELRRRRGDRPVRHDPVTGLMTRAQLDHVLNGAVLRSKEGGTALSLALLDVDGFKSINDTYGHVAGDEVLREIAQRVSVAAAQMAALGRFGGDELIAVFEGVPVDGAGQVAEDMRQVVAATPLPAGEVLVGVTVTIGVAGYQGGTVKELIAAADAAMYAAKRAGRNQVGRSTGSAQRE
jgi:diguanylate cyclase (GGDEF)-like protein